MFTEDTIEERKGLELLKYWLGCMPKVSTNRREVVPGMLEVSRRLTDFVLMLPFVCGIRARQAPK